MTTSIPQKLYPDKLRTDLPFIYRNNAFAVCTNTSLLNKLEIYKRGREERFIYLGK